MKKILFLFGAMLTISTSVSAQTPVGEGNIIIDPYIGVPNWANSILYSNLETENSTWTNYKVNGGVLSYGGRVEYMMADNFGIGIDLNYELSGYNYDMVDSTYVPSTDGYTTETNNYDYKAKKLRAMARLNYHFVQNDRVDAYAGFAGGYKYVNRKATVNNQDDANSTELSGALIPVSIRLAIGARFYFTDNIGAHVELGAGGGGLLQFGLSIKL
ncbi:MAG: outer membrane beta-barrel protein [Crocinitomicaceae bacterium]|nr:outer membrane beta-barrel protein [Crocinitomicaceae bacterium]